VDKAGSLVAPDILETTDLLCIGEDRTGLAWGESIFHAWMKRTVLHTMYMICLQLCVSKLRTAESESIENKVQVCCFSSQTLLKVRFFSFLLRITDNWSLSVQISSLIQKIQKKKFSKTVLSTV
jgi:hypothetical protein